MLLIRVSVPLLAMAPPRPALGSPPTLLSEKVLSVTVSVPLLQGANGLPIGVQLVGPRHGDGRLLRTARWLAEWGGILGRP